MRIAGFATRYQVVSQESLIDRVLHSITLRYQISNSWNCCRLRDAHVTRRRSQLVPKGALKIPNLIIQGSCSYLREHRCQTWFCWVWSYRHKRSMLTKSSIYRCDGHPNRQTASIIAWHSLGEMYMQQNMGYGNCNWISDELLEGPTESQSWYRMLESEFSDSLCFLETKAYNSQLSSFSS